MYESLSSHQITRTRKEKIVLRKYGNLVVLNRYILRVLFYEEIIGFEIPINISDLFSENLIWELYTAA